MGHQSNEMMIFESAIMEVVKLDVGCSNKADAPWYASAWQPYYENKKIEALLIELQAQAEIEEEVQLARRAKWKWIRATSMASMPEDVCLDGSCKNVSGKEL